MTGVDDGVVEGPASYENCRAAASGQPRRATHEVILYSDVGFTDEWRDPAGPISLLNPIRMERGRVGASIVLRCHVHHAFELPQNWDKPDLSRFTGASFWDEIACLVSLQHGARLVAGDISRTFDGSDPLGEPRTDSRPPIVYSPARRSTAVLPWVLEDKRIVPGLLPKLHQLTPREALALLRAARSYRDAIWIAEADPQLAWLLLVSALEVAAAHTAAPDGDDLEGRFREAMPKLTNTLDSIGADAVALVAPHLVHLIKSTARFLHFFERFPPPPPERRPPEGFRFRPWESSMKKALSTVYDWRSKALHGGAPFPPPMCNPPHVNLSDWSAPCETVPGLAAHTQGGTWTRNQMPFTLHLFEYIARQSLLAWWQGMHADPSGST